jgi:hypothetical protein
MVRANTKQNLRQNRGVTAHKTLKLVLLSNYYPFLPSTQGANCNQPVEPAKDWRSNCLGEQDLLVGELCGFLGRLHSLEGLAQSNNNAKLNYSAKHDQMLLETSAKAEESNGIKTGKKVRWKGARCVAQTREKPRAEIGSRDDGHSSIPFFGFCFF